MLQELLQALLGYTGDLIIDEREQQQSSVCGVNLSPYAPISEECTFKLALDLSFIQPSDRDVIERIITLGFYYRELDRFSTKSRDLSWIRCAKEFPLSRTSELLSKGKQGSSSVYRRAIANGIVEMLSVYRSAVLQIEQKLLSDSIMPILATVTQGLNKEFNKKSNSLYTILRSSRLAGSQRASFLWCFLLRLNFNFFETTARGVLNVVRPSPSLPVLNQQ